MEVDISGKIVEIPDNYDPRNDKNAYMNEKQKAYFKIKLQEQLNDIKKRLAAENINDVNADYRSTDESDQIAMEANTITELRMKDRLRKLAKKIEEFIRKIDADTYGFCEETGNEIGINRLMLNPTARFCIEVQERKDREEKEKEFLDKNQEEQINRIPQEDDFYKKN